MARSRSARPVPALPVTFRAGCSREWTLAPSEVASAEADLAYTEQAFPECPACPHRVEPEGTLPFCTLRPVGAAHPFAALAGLQLPE
ncbi:hypothetical protein QOL99_12285 [Deinococcus sp. MIMF12]|uniref:Uncharacterized protein n=1 Tax=Deinococcus rhizophilus TaxID=3049544 RepID=A0ABT7JIP0_9DEIO|nr:hypothetical protein [Deinococcus rhizophilus]MDL2344923.1 hypothetical protein [Deinococcus rhizophilus]